MEVSYRSIATGALALAMGLSLSGCVVKDHEVVHHDGGGSYEQGYQEGYYDREHHRWWHENAWRECVEHDIHCPS